MKYFSLFYGDEKFEKFGIFRSFFQVSLRMPSF